MAQTDGDNSDSQPDMLPPPNPPIQIHRPKAQYGFIAAQQDMFANHYTGRLKAAFHGLYPPGPRVETRVSEFIKILLRQPVINPNDGAPIGPIPLQLAAPPSESAMEWFATAHKREAHVIEAWFGELRPYLNESMERFQSVFDARRIEIEVAVLQSARQKRRTPLLAQLEKQIDELEESGKTYENDLLHSHPVILRAVTSLSPFSGGGSMDDVVQMFGEFDQI